MNRTGPVAPITFREFADAMRTFAPFERAPHVAVAVSGGADSMALATLADAWTRRNGGVLTALIVDHGIRPESAAEARLTAARLDQRSIRSVVLNWPGEKPSSGVQAAARTARYALLDSWCRENGVLHLLVAHHADDQAETFLMRLKRGSGPDGLAAMQRVRELSSCRLLRPLLDFPKARLVATLKSNGLDWVEDPSNQSAKYARTAIRSELTDADNDPRDFVIASGRFARAREALEASTADWLARNAALYPAGYLEFGYRAWRTADEEIRLRVIARAARSIGGKVFTPDIAALERLAAKLEGGNGATLGGARFDPVGEVVGVFREARNLPVDAALQAGSNGWDGRFIIHVPEGHVGISALAWSPSVAENWPRNNRPAWYCALPARARAGVPVLFDGTGHFVRNPADPKNVGISLRFAPKMPLTGGGFSVA
ncbi:MAG: tRNA lysidine(34) synthetase TilS [Rhodospirillales bacterium]|nr:tRNA lysidine(34) synthetase TilS [Rhodospirillales bacterium]MBO6787488.1 tRNA lysidine(34) synthetase TilS [Rhodospirillales bacterium]